MIAVAKDRHPLGVVASGERFDGMPGHSCGRLQQTGFSSLTKEI